MPSPASTPDSITTTAIGSRWVFWFLWSSIVLMRRRSITRRPPTINAFVRWRPQVQQFWDGVNIYDRILFPNPPMIPDHLTRSGSAHRQGAMCWFAVSRAVTAA